MENFVKMFYKWQWLLFLLAAAVLLSCKSDEKVGIPKYDPNRDIVLESFSPTSGPIATMVILRGDNFGDNADDVRVWFNEKPAAVISAKGDRILTLAPKLPGDECILSVVIEGDSVCYDNVFNYLVQTTVSTLAGGDQSATSMPTGTIDLGMAQFSGNLEHTLAVDPDDNLFLSINDGATYYFYMANEEADRLRLLASSDVIVGGYMVGLHHGTGNVYWRMFNGTANGYNYFDRTAEYASLSAGNITWDIPLVEEDGGMDLWGSYRVLSSRPSDGKFYLRGNRGELGRFDPETGQGENLSPGVLVPYAGGTTYGLVFDRHDDNIFYFSVDDRHCIYKYDLRTAECEIFAGQQGGSGHLDGELHVARFNSPRQMCIDSNDNMYVADKNNHCIRKISLETGYVSTVAGIPEQAGYTNGTASYAQFNSPIGIAVTSEDILYIGDSENRAIRRLAIE